MAQLPGNPLVNIKKSDFTELKALASPPQAVKIVFEAVLCLLGHEDRSWKNAKALMADPNKFVNMLQGFDADNVSARTLRELQPFLSDPSFHPHVVKAKSAAAEGLCQWVRDVAACAQRGSPAQSLSPERPPQARP